MMIDEAILAYSLAFPGLAALVGTRIFHSHWPENWTPVFPLILFFKVSGPRHHDINVAFPRYQFSAYAETQGEALAVADQVRDCWQRRKVITGGVEVIQGVHLNELDMYDPVTKLYHIPTDIKIIYRE